MTKKMPVTQTKKPVEPKTQPYGDNQRSKIPNPNGVR